MEEFREERNLVGQEVRQVTHRNYETYLSCFNLPEDALGGMETVVDVGAGFSSFCQEARDKFSGLKAIAVDPVYSSIKSSPELTKDELEKQQNVFLDLDPSYRGEGKVNLETYDEQTSEYFREFVQELKAHPSDYIAASHQDLPLSRSCADLVLASNSIIRAENEPSVIDKALRECVRIIRDDGEIRVAGAMACFGFEPGSGQLELWFNGELVPGGRWVEEYKQTGHYSDPELMVVFKNLELEGLKFYAVKESGTDQHGNAIQKVVTIIIRKDERKPSIIKDDNVELRKANFLETDGFNIPTILID